MRAVARRNAGWDDRMVRTHHVICQRVVHRLVLRHYQAGTHWRVKRLMRRTPLKAAEPAGRYRTRLTARIEQDRLYRWSHSLVLKQQRIRTWQQNWQPFWRKNARKKLA